MSTTPNASNAPKPADLSVEKLRRLPPSATQDFVRFRTQGDEEALTRLIIAVLTDHSPDKAKAVTAWGPELRLIEDIGFDSLAIAETVFFVEDLFQISISNEEIMQVQTMGELRNFVKAKVAATGV